MVESDEDRDVVLSPDDFGVVARLDPLGGWRDISAIFDHYDEVSPFLARTTGISSPVPILTCRTSDVSDVVKGSTVEVADQNYSVRHVVADGTGITTLYLILA